MTDADKLAEAVKALKQLEPYLDGIVCYASTMGEHEPNQIASDVRVILTKLGGEHG